MLNLAPRCTATSPATTPAAPTAVASHKAVTTAPGDMWMGRTTQGGPTAGMTTGGYAESLRTSDAKIMIRIELLMHVKASHQSTRATRVTSTSGARLTAGPARRSGRHRSRADIFGARQSRPGRG